MAAIIEHAMFAAAATRGFEALVGRLERWARPANRLLGVITYHRVDEADARPELYPGMISAAPAAFREQMELLDSRFNVVSLEEVLATRRGEGELPDRAVLVTFDDAYRDFAEHAWPVMRELGLPVTLFVPTAYPDAPGRRFWWDRVYRAVCRSERPRMLSLPWGQTPLEDAAQRMRTFKRIKEHVKTLPQDDAAAMIESVCSEGEMDEPRDNGVSSWDELRRLHAEGVTLAPHSRTHGMLNRMPPEQVRDELSGSWNDLRAHIGPDIPRVLAYPAGGVNASAAGITRESGFELAFTTRRGINDPSCWDPLLLNRINVGRRTTPAILRAQLLPQLRFVCRRWARGRREN